MGRNGKYKGVGSSLPTLTAVAVAESAWVYLVALCLTAAVHLSIRLGPAVVLLPFGASAASAFAVSRWMALARSLVSNLSVGVAGGLPARTWTARTARTLASRSLAILTTGIAAVTYIALCAATLLSVAWWEMYSDLPILSSAWLGKAAGDAHLSADVVSPLVWLVLIGLILWIRGTVLGRGDVNLPPPLVRFVWGAAIVLCLAVFGAADRLDSTRVFVLVAAYLLAGLLAVLSYRLDHASRNRAGPGTWRWWTVVAGSAAVLAGLAGAYALTLWLSEPIRALWDSVVLVVSPLVTAVAAWILGLFGHDTALPAPPEPRLPNGPGAQPSFFEMPERIREVGRWLFNASWIGIILYSVYSTVSRWLLGEGERNDRSEARQRMGFDLWLIFRQLALALVLLLSRVWPPILRFLATGDRAERGWTTRELYRRLLEWSARRSVPMERWMTPHEHRLAMCSAWPQLREEFALIVDGYVRTRYGAVPLDQDEVAAGLSAWHRIDMEGTKAR